MAFNIVVTDDKVQVDHTSNGARHSFPRMGNKINLSTDGVLTVLENTDDLERDVWDQIPGNSSEFENYVGVLAPSGNFGNPSGTTTNVKTITYKTGAAAIYYRDLEWAADDTILKITAR